MPKLMRMGRCHVRAPATNRAARGWNSWLAARYAAHGVRDHHRYGRQKDEEVESDRPVVDVQDVQPAIGVEGRVVSRFELPEPGYARFDAVPTQQFSDRTGRPPGEGRDGGPPSSSSR